MSKLKLIARLINGLAESWFEDVAYLLYISNVESEQFFKITETAAVSSCSWAQYLMGKRKALARSLALDDFGVGFCGFSI